MGDTRDLAVVRNPSDIVLHSLVDYTCKREGLFSADVGSFRG